MFPYRLKVYCKSPWISMMCLLFKAISKFSTINFDCQTFNHIDTLENSEVLKMIQAFVNR